MYLPFLAPINWELLNNTETSLFPFALCFCHGLFFICHTSSTYFHHLYLVYVLEALPYTHTFRGRTKVGWWQVSHRDTENSLAIQWLGPCAFPCQRPRLDPWAEELRSCKPCSTVQIKIHKQGTRKPMEYLILPGRARSLNQVMFDPSFIGWYFQPDQGVRERATGRGISMSRSRGVS